MVYLFVRLVLEEERDYLMEQCFRAQTELARLKSSESMKDGKYCIRKCIVQMGIHLL